jgi:hypothetical protein
MTSNSSQKGKDKDRKLGDEWSDWDGSSVSETRAGKRLFISLSIVVLVVFAGLLGFAWYLVAPRLAQWHPLAPTVFLALCGLGVVVLGLELCTVTLSLWTGWPLPRPLTTVTRWLLIIIERRVFALGRRLAIDRDRIAHSLIKIHNALVLSEDNRRTDPARVLVLLPRCLIKPQIQEARQLADTYGVKVAVVAGGELARQRINELRPKAVIGVACERDLLSGIRDVGGRLEVLAIPNTRPHGPCKDTVIDLDQLSRAIEFYVRPDGRAERSSAFSGTPQGREEQSSASLTS